MGHIFFHIGRLWWSLPHITTSTSSNRCWFVGIQGLVKCGPILLLLCSRNSVVQIHGGKLQRRSTLAYSEPYVDKMYRCQCVCILIVPVNITRNYANIDRTGGHLIWALIYILWLYHLPDLPCWRVRFPSSCVFSPRGRRIFIPRKNTGYQKMLSLLLRVSA